MKFLLLLIGLHSITIFTSAQTSDISRYEVKVISYQYKTTKGELKKVTPEGIGMEDAKGNYIIFRTSDIAKIKVKSNGLSLGKAVSSGTLLGLGIGGALWSLDEHGQNTADMVKLTVALAATGAVVGTVVGGVAELSNGRLTLKVNGNQAYFTKHYQRLESYLSY